MAQEFAAELTATFAGVLGADCPSFVAERSPVPKGKQTRVAIHTSGSEAIPLTIGDVHCLSLIVDYECVWDHGGNYLKVRNAHMHVVPAKKGAPLFRFEYVDAMQGTLPAAHLHIHAHRDELLYALFRGGHGKPAVRAQAFEPFPKRAEPHVAEIHFPLGGPRMRPSVEDVLQMLHEEFDVDMVEGFQDVLDIGRARWRRHQIGALVRDAPEVAARVLRELGYEVGSPTDGPRAERLDRLTQM
jgi:hypothetical protein